MESLLWDRCQVLGNTSTIDDFGSENQTSGVVATYPCRAIILPAHPKNTEIGTENIIRSQWEIILPLSASADVDEHSVLQIGAETYVVLDTDKGRTGALLLLARCRKDK